jgi:AcrR family transcriptional regulator
MPMTLRDHQRAHTRQRLLASGRELFERNGYAATKVEDIAAGADASKATLYAYFKTKTDLITALWDGVDTDFTRRYQNLDRLLFGTGRASRAKLSDWLAGELEFWRANARLIEVTRQARAVEPLMPAADEAAAAAQCIDSMTGFLARGREHREQRRQRAILLERMTAHTFEQLSLGHLDADEAVALDLLTDLWWMVFQPGRAHRD